jgi:hypothetical protein
VTSILVVAAVLAILALAVGRQLWRLLHPQNGPSFNARWFARFSMARYRPMERVLGEADFEFLSRQPGVDKKTLRTFRAERREIFRAYVRDIASDFHRLHGAARILLLTSMEDRPDLAMTLFKLRATFAYAMLAIQWRLALDAMGVRGLNVQPLVEAVDGMRGQLVGLMPAPASAQF